MNRFYTTTAPDKACHILMPTVGEAVAEARDKTAEDGQTRYVVQVIYKIEPASKPVRVSKVR